MDRRCFLVIGSDIWNVETPINVAHMLIRLQNEKKDQLYNKTLEEQVYSSFW